jgi:hypothetical protein
MAQQTAMQEMIKWAISQKDNEQQCIDWIAIKSKAEELLPMEKEHIIKSSRISYLAGQEYYTLNGLSKQFAEEYYNKTYTK